MRALLSQAPGGPETLIVSDLPDPVAGPGQLLVRVRAAAINFPDVLIIEDKYQFKPPRPFSPGGEISGIVKSVGDGVTHVKPGDRVLANTGSGGMAQELAVEAGRLRLPIDRTFPLEEAVEAQAHMRTNAHFGKIVLTV